MMKRVIVTGSGGFIGKMLTRSLLKRGYFVYAITRCMENLKELGEEANIEIIEGDINDCTKIESQIKEKIDIVFHLAWQGISANDYKDIVVQRQNIFMTTNVMDMAIKLKAEKFVFIGTNQQYLKNLNHIDGMNSSSSVYGGCKLACRNICEVMAFGKIHFNTVLFTNIFGVGDRSKRTANTFISKITKGIELDLIQGDNLYDWTYIDDAVEGIIAVGENGTNNKEYYVGSRSLRTFKEILIEVRDILNPKVPLNFGKYKDSSYTDYSKIDLDALHNDTGFECRTNFRESILKTSEWVKKLDL